MWFRRTMGRVLGAAIFGVVVYALLGAAIIYRMDRVTVDGVDYYTQDTNTDITPIHRLAIEHLRASEFFDDDFSAKVFITRSSFEFRILSFFQSSGAFANTFPVLGYIVVASASIPNDTIKSSSARQNMRSLSDVLAHEFTHILLYRAFELKALMAIPTWKIEGYADYIAQESSFPADTGRALFCASEKNPSPSYAYYRYRLAVGYVLDDSGLTFRDLAARPEGFSDVEQQAKRAVCP